MPGGGTDSSKLFSSGPPWSADRVVLVGNFITASGHFMGFGPTWVGSSVASRSLFNF